MGSVCNSSNANQTSQTTSAPAWWSGAAQRAIEQNEIVGNGQYTPYGGQRVAGFNPDQENAFQGVRNTQGVGDPYMQAAGNYATLGAAPVTTQQILDQYNPYIDSQVNQYQQDANYRGQMETQGLNSQIAQQGALTGDRGQVARQLAAESRNRVDSNNVANIRSQGYNEAARIAEGNRDAARSGAGQFSQLGSQAQNLAYTDANALMGTGGLQQQYAQAQLDVPYQDYLAAQAKPYEDQMFKLQGLQAVQGGAGSTTTKTVPEPSKFSQYLGLGSTLGSMALKAAPFMLSDERAKTDIQEIGKTHDGLPIYSFKMPGDETGGQSTKIGLMAQDVAQVKPDAVGDMGGGMLGVDYKRATEGAEGMAGGGPVDRFAFASKAGDLGHFQNVDPDLSRMANHLGQAVEAIKKHSGPGAGDYHRGKSEGQMAGHEEGFAKGGEVEKGEHRLKGLEKQLQDSQKMLQESERKASENAARLDAIERTSLADKAQVKGEESGYKSGMKDAKSGGDSKKMADGGEVGTMSGLMDFATAPFTNGGLGIAGMLMNGENPLDMGVIGMGRQIAKDPKKYASNVMSTMGMGGVDIPKQFSERGLGALPHMAAGGSPLDIAPLPYKSRDAGYVPKSQLAPSAPMPGADLGSGSGGGSEGGGSDSMGAFKQFGNDALDYFKPKMDMGINDWATGTTVTPGFAAGGSPVDPGTLPFYDDIREVGVGGMGGLDEKGSSYVPETKLVSSPTVPPTATEYTDPVAEEGSMTPLSGLGVPDNTDPSILPQDSSGKPWYASAGDYLGDFGAASMAGESPYGLINVGRALTGANSLSVGRLEQEQEQRNKDRSASQQAARLQQEADRYQKEFGFKERQQAESERHNKAAEAKGNEPESVRKYLFARENGFEGGYTDFIEFEQGAAKKDEYAAREQALIKHGGDANSPEGQAFILTGRSPNQSGLNPPNGYRFAEDGKTLEAIPGGPAEHLTESESKDASFAERILRSEKDLGTLLGASDEGGQGYDPTTWRQNWFPDDSSWKNLWLANAANSSEWQQYKRAAREGIAAILRKDTGAAVSDTEWDWYFPMYYPQPGDKAEAIGQKQLARKQIAQGLRAGSGRAFKKMYPEFSDDGLSGDKPPTGAPDGTKKAADGNWYAPDPARPGKFLRVQ